MSLKSLKITKNEKTQAALDAQPVSAEGVEERYSYGTRITLGKDELQKLNIQALPSVGSELFFEARAKVIGSRQSATEHSDDLSLELQITHMDVEADEGDDDDDLSRETQTPMSRVAKKMKFM